MKHLKKKLLICHIFSRTWDEKSGMSRKKDSLITAIKILQHDYQNGNEGWNQLNYDEDKSSGYNFNKVPSKQAKKTNITSYLVEIITSIKKWNPVQ